jgi:hypothetical protein
MLAERSIATGAGAHCGWGRRKLLEGRQADREAEAAEEKRNKEEYDRLGRTANFDGLAKANK